MRNNKILAAVTLGALFFMVGCGGAGVGQAAPPAPPTVTPAANNAPPAEPAPAQAQTATAANFTTSGLTVTPDKAKPGDRVMVGVTVTNTGTQQGTYKVTVKDHDGKVLGTKDVSLAGGGKEDVNLHITVNTTGTHMVMIDKLWHNLVIAQDAANATVPPPPPAGMPGMQPPAQPTQPPPTNTAPTAGTGFVVSSLGVDPTMADPGEDLIVSFKVTNNTGKAGTYHAEVKVDGTTVATKDFEFAAGETKLVNIQAKAPGKDGNYKFSVGDQSCMVNVMAM